jgi:hypothetical protein
VCVAIAVLLVGREAGKWLFGANTNISNLKRSAQSLAIVLREFGLKLLPTILEAFVVGNVADLLAAINEMATVAKSGNEAILKELDGTFDRVLEVKLRSPEGRALLKAQLQAAEAAAIAAGPMVARQRSQRQPS